MLVRSSGNDAAVASFGKVRVDSSFVGAEGEGQILCSNGGSDAVFDVSSAVAKVVPMPLVLASYNRTFLLLLVLVVVTVALSGHTSFGTPRLSAL